MMAAAPARATADPAAPPSGPGGAVVAGLAPLLSGSAAACPDPAAALLPAGASAGSAPFARALDALLQTTAGTEVAVPAVAATAAPLPAAPPTAAPMPGGVPAADRAAPAADTAPSTGADTVTILTAILRWLQQQPTALPPAQGGEGADTTHAGTPTAHRAVRAPDDPASDAPALAIGAIALFLPAQPVAATPAPRATPASSTLPGVASGRPGRAADVGIAAGEGSPPPNVAVTGPVAGPAPSGTGDGASLAGSDAGASRDPVAARRASIPASAAGAPDTDLAAVLRGFGPGGAERVPAPDVRSVPVHVHDPHWPRAIAAQLVVLSDQKVESATLRLSPEHLGPVEVHIEIQDSRVNLNFGAAHAETRAALEQALPQLRDVFASAGLSLGEASVQQQMRRDSHAGAADPRSAPPAADEDAPPPAPGRALGLVDEYV